MNIHEYQGKELLRRYGVAVLDGHVAWTAEEADAAAAQAARPGLCGEVADPRRRPRRRPLHRRPERQGRRARRQVGRGRASAAAEAMIGHTLVTKQTGARGQAGHPRLCRGRLRHQARALPRPCWWTATPRASPSWPRPRAAWRSRRWPSTTPRRSCKVAVDPASGISGFHARKLAFGLGLKGKQVGVLHQVRPRRCTAPSSSSTARSSRSTRWW